MSKICERCSTVNDDRYSYCKNCGIPLDATANANRQEPIYTTDSDNYGGEIDGVPVSDVVTFVGKSSGRLVGKIMSLSMSKTKFIPCWPVMLLSFLLGVFGAALWFLYRKMYKLGFLLIAVAVLLTAVRTVIVAKPMIEYMNNTNEMMYYVINNELSNEQLQQVISDFEQETNRVSLSKEFKAANFISNIEQWGSMLILGAFAIYFYKKFAINRIKSYREKNGINQYYDVGIAALGGTSGGMLAIGVIIALITPMIISGVFVLFNFLNI